MLEASELARVNEPDSENSLHQEHVRAQIKLIALTLRRVCICEQ